jgi:putative ABC transport system substrate-binding protein
MERRAFIGTLAGGFLVAPLAAEAQETGKVYRIGVPFLPTQRETALYIPALNEGLRELGYVEGQNLIIERRFADGSWDRFRVLVAELVSLNVDVLVVGTDDAAVAAKQVTTKVPIVQAVSEDPVGAGLVQSLARPGGNVTGVTIVSGPEIFGKNLELLHEALPMGERIGILFNPTSRINALYLKATEEAAQRLRVTLLPTAVRSTNEFDKALARMKQGRVAGFVVLGHTLFTGNRQRLNDLALRSGLAAMWHLREGAETGLMSYSTSLTGLWRRSAAHVDKILKGAKPGDLPMEQPTKYDLVINLKTAKALGLTIPPSLLLRADRVIE